VRALTLPSRGRPQAGFAHLRPPLMSNVRRRMQNHRALTTKAISGPPDSNHSNRHSARRLLALQGPLLRRLPGVRRPTMRRNENSPYLVARSLSGQTQPLLSLRYGLSRLLAWGCFWQGHFQSQCHVLHRARDCMGGHSRIVLRRFAPVVHAQTMATSHGHEPTFAPEHLARRPGDA
jgi:hypothetical protein